jgi:uncharacterized protein (TIRG00374 family)
VAANEVKSANGNRRDWGKWWGYLSTAVSIILILVGIYYLLAEISLAELADAFAQANLPLIIVGLFITLVTLLLKVWRWQFLLATKQEMYPFASLFWALMLGFYVNTVLPFLRLGEIARIYALNLQTGAGKIRTLSTLVVEKILELIFLGLTAVLMLPFIVLPPEWRAANPGILLGGAAAVTLFCLYLVAFQTEWLQKQIHRLSGIMPDRIGASAGEIVRFRPLRSQRAAQSPPVRGDLSAHDADRDQLSAGAAGPVRRI